MCVYVYVAIDYVFTFLEYVKFKITAYAKELYTYRIVHTFPNKITHITHTKQH